MNLLTDSFIPVITASGQRRIITVSEVTRTDDPAIALACDRGDFGAALAQFLITLFQYVIAPDAEDTWVSLLHEPPKPSELEVALDDLRHAFELEGKWPFMQDAALDPSLGIRPLDSLLLESPGENALKNNTDLFVKRQSQTHWGPAQAALALLTLQINAPSGGQGHRTSLRGGGPLTTLVWPENVIGLDGSSHPATLWQKVWCNVLPTSEPPPSDHRIALPWTTACITSEDGRSVLEGWPRTPTQGERMALCGFATPRRILLLWEGEEGDRHCIGYATRNYGANYPSDQFRHPASPYYRDANGAWLPHHIGEAGFSYQHFTRYCARVGADANPQNLQAVVVAHALDSDERRRVLGDTTSLWACGYAMDNAKVMAWHEAHYPLFPHVPDTNRRAMWLEADKLVLASNEAASQLGRSLRKLGGDVPLAIRGLRDQTEAAFYAALHAIATDTSAEQRIAQRESWLLQLLKATVRHFDDHADRQVDTQSRLSRVQRAAEERLFLWRSLNKALHKALELKPAEPASRKIASKDEEVA